MVTSETGRRAGIKVLLVIFAIIAVASLPLGVRAYSMPVEENVLSASCSYSHYANYYYTAYLKPNDFYGNRETLGPSDGTIYTNLVDNLEITLDYTFTSSSQAEYTTEYTVDMYIAAPDKWTKSFPTGLENSITLISKTTWFSTKLSVVVEWFENTKENIEGEIGSSSSSYEIRVKPTVHTSGVTPAGTVDDLFIPELVVTFAYDSAAGNNITFSGMDNSAEGSVQQYSPVSHPEIANERNIFLVVALAGLIGLAVTGMYYYRTKPEEPEKKIREMMSQFEGAIVEVGSEPPVKGLNKVKMNSLQELVYVGEGLGKPVLHFRKPGEKEVHAFYLIDGSTMYEYVFG